MFGDLFGNRGAHAAAAPRPQRGADVETSATIGFTDAIEGVTISLRLTSDAPVPRLLRHRRQARHQAPHLPRVRGRRLRGRLDRRRVLDERDLPGVRRPPAASTTSRARPATARAAGMSARSIQARIPAGVKDGQRIRLKGKGGAGENGGPAGDLFVAVKVRPAPGLRPQGRQPHPRRAGLLRRGRARRRGQDPDPGAAPPVTLKIPAGTPNGRTFRVRGKGARRSDGTLGRPAGDRRGAGARRCSTRPPARPSRPTATATAGKPLRGQPLRGRAP